MLILIPFTYCLFRKLVKDNQRYENEKDHTDNGTVTGADIYPADEGNSCVISIPIIIVERLTNILDI